MKLGFLVFSLIMGWSGVAQAQPFILWQQSTLRYTLNSNWSISGEIQPRWWDSFSNSQAVILRGALIYRFNPEWAAGLGYARVDQDLSSNLNENRIFTQLQYSHPPFEEHHLKLSGRFRLEDRLIERMGKPIYRTRFQTALHWMPTEWGAYAWAEPFFNLNHRHLRTVKGFEQLRFSVGPRFSTGPLTVEAGYLTQGNKSISGAMTWLHGVMMSIGVSF